jgi:hypothetical protein
MAGFKKGAFSVAGKAGVDVVPVTLLGTGDLMPSGMSMEHTVCVSGCVGGGGWVVGCGACDATWDWQPLPSGGCVCVCVGRWGRGWEGLGGVGRSGCVPMTVTVLGITRMVYTLLWCFAFG